MSMTSEQTGSRAASLPLVGGVLALDFANTASGRETEGFRENLQSAADLVAWARHAAVLDGPAEMRLQRRCEDEPSFARRLLAGALRLRDAIYRLDAALAQNRGPAQDDVDMVAATHAACLGRGRLTTQDGGFGWTWDVESAPEEAVLGPDRGFGHGAHHHGRPCEAEAMPGPPLRLALPRHDQEQQPALVRDGGLRQPRQAEAPPRPLGRLWASQLRKQRSSAVIASAAKQRRAILDHTPGCFVATTVAMTTSKLKLRRRSQPYS